MCSHQINKLKYNLKTIFSFTRFPAWVLQKMPERLSLSVKNINVFGRGPPDPPIFLTNHLRAGGNGRECKIGASEAS
jgi:hypothetical protein